MRIRAAVYGLVAWVGWAGGAQAAIYSGSLTWPTGLVATEQWADPATTFSWEVDAAGPNWKYTYRLQVPAKEISHFIIEVSDDFTDADIISWSGTNFPVLDYYDANSQGNSNPGMPGAFTKGLKFQAAGWGIDQTVTLITPRAPKWADLYAKDGQSGGPGGGNDVILYNTGFLVADPLVGPHNGTELYHILAPDTRKIPPQGGPDIPEPGTLALVSVGLLGVLRRRRR